MQAYRFALDPSPAQERALWPHCGAARLAFNWGLAYVKAVMDQRAAEASYGIAAQDLAPVISWTLPALRKAWNQAKDQVAPWWGENSKEAYNTGLDALARALGNYRVSPVQVPAQQQRQLDYKTGWNGGSLVAADRWYPSSKTCSACQTVKTKLSLSVRVFTCEHCGLVLDRNVNAARNLAALAAIPGPGAAGPTPPGGNARGADQKTRPHLAGGDETGTVHAPHGTARHGLSPEKGD